MWPAKRSRASIAHSVAPTIIAQVLEAEHHHANGTGAEPEPDAAVLGLVQRWVKLSDFERRTFAALCRELAGTSDVIEGGVGQLTERFGALADHAQQQTDLVGSIIGIAEGIEVDGNRMSLSEVTGYAEAALKEVIETIQVINDHSKRMIAALDQAAAQVAQTEKAIVEIERINNSANLLALNAMIEAHRAGDAGRTFVVVANEVRDLSKATNQMAETMRRDVTGVANGIRSTHDILEAVTKLDLDKHYVARSRLDSMMRGLTEQSRQFEAALSSAMGRSSEIATLIRELVTGIQFQDRSKQNLEQVVGALSVLDGALAELSSESAHVTKGAEIEATAAADEQWIQEMIERFTLGDVRKRFISRVVLGEEEPAVADVDHRGSVELF